MEEGRKAEINVKYHKESDQKGRILTEWVLAFLGHQSMDLALHLRHLRHLKKTNYDYNKLLLLSATIKNFSQKRKTHPNNMDRHRVRSRILVMYTSANLDQTHPNHTVMNKKKTGN